MWTRGRQGVLQESPDSYPNADLASSNTIADADCVANSDADSHSDT
jgi:hypothetical protein